MIPLRIELQDGELSYEPNLLPFWATI